MIFLPLKCGFSYLWYRPKSIGHFGFQFLYQTGTKYWFQLGTTKGLIFYAVVLAELVQVVQSTLNILWTFISRIISRRIISWNYCSSSSVQLSRIFNLLHLLAIIYCLWQLMKMIGLQNTLLKKVYIYTANVCRELQGLYREIGVQGFQIYGDCMYNCNPCNFEISTLLFPL